MNQPAAVPQGYYPNQVSRLNLASAKFQRYKSLLARRWWILFLAASIGVCIQAWKTSTKPTTFASYARLVVGGQIVLPGTDNYRSYTHDFYGTTMELLRSGEVRKRATERVEALNPDLRVVPVSVRVDRNPNSSMLNLSADGAAPEYTVAYLNALLDEFLSFRKEINVSKEESAITAITEELVRLEKAISEKEEDLNAFLSENNIVVLEQGGNRAASYLAGLQGRKSGLETELELLQLMDLDQGLDHSSKKERQAQGLTGEGEQDEVDREVMSYLQLGSSERSYLAARHTIEMLMLDRNRKAKLLKERHPEIVSIDEKITKELTMLEIHKEQSAAESQRRIEGMRLQIQNLNNQMVKWEEKALDMSGRIAKYGSLNSAIDRIKTRYDRMLRTLEDIDQGTNLQQDPISIMERASSAIPKEPDWKKPVLMGLISGLVLGLVIVFLFDKLDDRMTSFSEFQTHFTEDVLGQVPQQPSRGQLALLEPNDGRHLYGEAFRNLRSSIIFKDWGGNPPKTIAVCSAVPNEGKTTVATNLGITMALAGARVLVADADLRRGALNDLLGKSSTPGFSDVLMGKIEWEDAITDTHIDNLSFLPRGEAIDQTSEYVLSDRCTRFLEDVAESYDYVIFDTAPVLVADDTASFAPKCDASLFVVRLSSTMARLAAKALGILYDRQVNIGGIVLNRASTSLKEYSYYNYASYYTARPTGPAIPIQDPEGAEDSADTGAVEEGSEDGDNDGLPPVTKI